MTGIVLRLKGWVGLELTHVDVDVDEFLAF
jgi:hypothetical protein